MQNKLYDILGIGIGPFNLGLAALCEELPELNCLFIDQQPNFDWHPGMLIPGTRMQVPFYADLVTLAAPSNPYSYLNYLKETQSLLRFAFRENHYISRHEYAAYCQWVASKLHNLLFDCRCESIVRENGSYVVHTNMGWFQAKKLVIGTGWKPKLPSFVEQIDHPFLLHAGNYMFHKSALLQQPTITVVGSGQSAAEIFQDLLTCYHGKLSWFSRSSRFIPMDNSKFALEMASPDYIDHFFQLPDDVRQQVLVQQDSLYKGINAELITAIYEKLADTDPKRVEIHCNCELLFANQKEEDLLLHFRHCELKQDFEHQTGALILATGYQPCWPGFLDKIAVRRQPDRDYSIDEHRSIFVQNIELATHGFSTSDLSLGPYRNATILNSILAREHFKIERKVSFQKFGLPKGSKNWGECKVHDA